MPDERDRINVGLSRRGDEDLAVLMEKNWFDQELDAYRVAIAVALARSLPIESGPLPGLQNKFNIGSLDRDGRLRALISHLGGAPTRPYETAEKLADAGMRYLREQIVDAGRPLTEVLLDASQLNSAD